MNIHGMVPNEIKSRAVESDVLPYYPYRDDAMLIYLTIRKYVSKVVHRFYGNFFYTFITRSFLSYSTTKNIFLRIYLAMMLSRKRLESIFKI
ncbi:UNVERIFIED_CONTAM: hypothetical protein NCL1_18120 [Trichonephila clavipes]